MLVLGTAGHIDHGKTTVVRALTGIETDRLKVEQERGITTELGFAHLDLGDGRVASVVDAPGHEKFVRHMIAGAGGLDLAVLVVAADEGVMPQTREHLDILGLVGVRQGFIVLTKCDLLPPDERDLAREDVTAAVEGTFLAGQSVLEFHGGVPATWPAFREAFVGEVLRRFPSPPPRPVDRPFRMAIDRVFVMAGFGTVATGTVTAGRIGVGDEVEVLPSAVRGRVRGLQSHGETVDAVGPGVRAAVNVQGLERAEVDRGEVLAAPGALRPGPVLDATVRLLARAGKPMKRRTYVMVHVGTAQADGTVVLLDRDELPPGEEALCQVRLSTPVAVLAGDPFILRGFEALSGYGRTIGGGRVLTPGAPVRKAGASVDLLRTVRDGEPAARLAAAVELAGTEGLSLAGVLAVTDLGHRDATRWIGSLLSAGRLVAFRREGATRYLGAGVREALADDLAGELAASHARQPNRPAFPPDELRGGLKGRPPTEVVLLALKRLLERGGAVESPAGFARPGHATAGALLGDDALTRFHAVFRDAGLAPPTPAEAGVAAGLDAKAARDALGELQRRGELVRVATDLWFDAGVLARTRERLVAFLQERGRIGTTDMKELLGVSRKYAIPIAEWFDQQKVTIRVGDERKLRG